MEMSGRGGFVGLGRLGRAGVLSGCGHGSDLRALLAVPDDFAPCFFVEEVVEGFLEEKLPPFY